MMSIIVSSDSIHRGRRHVERVMDAWLPRLSSTVWGGYLSQESIKKIVDELNSCPRGTKNTMAVSIIWQHDHRFEQIFFVGNRKRLEEGLAALGVAKSKRPNRKIPEFIRNLMLAARLGGKTHDLGKATPYYQQLFRGEQSEKGLRHECISAQILNNLSLYGTPALDEAEPAPQPIKLAKLTDWGAATLAAVATHHGKRAHALSRPQKAFQLSRTPRQLNERLADEIASLAHKLAKRTMADTAFPLALFSTRMSLMLGDYAQSSFEKSMAYGQSGECHAKAQKDVMYAKSDPLVPLRAHLDNVAARAESTAKNLFLYDWPALAPFEKPALMKSAPAGRFRWQHQAEYLIRKIGLGEHDASFIVLAAETGSGKTIGGYRIMSALRNDRPRFNFAVGFGALAVQTEAEYRTALGLSACQVALVVGKRFRKQAGQTDKNTADIDEEIEVLHGQSHTIPETLESALSNKMRKIISTPIIVTTIDHLAHVAAMNKGDDIPSALRLATSDMFIDEIDSFDAQGLHVIARLAYLCGIYARHFVISSATVTPEIVRLLHHAWREGYRIYQSIFGGKAYMALITNVEQADDNLSKVFAQDEIEVMIEHMGYIAQVITRRCETSPRFLELLPLERRSDQDNGPFEQIFTHCLRLAGQHQQENFSGGFVMFNTAKDAQAFTRWMIDKISETDLDCHVKITCYTSRLSRKNRQKTERFLAKLYNRKNDTWLHAHEYQRLTDKGKKKCIHIVATTSIMGVGRDYDFDWCILEPATEKALIQAVGRVMRHRLQRPGSANVALMENTLHALKSKKKLQGEELFDPHGASPLSGNPLREKSDKAPANIHNLINTLEKASEGFALSQHKVGITSGFRLGEAPSVVDKVDRKYIEYIHHEGRGIERVPAGLSIARFLRDTLKKEADNPLISPRVDNITLRQRDQTETVKLDETEKNIHFVEIEDESMFALPLKHEPDDEIVVYLSLSKINYNPNLGYFSGQ